MAGRALGRRGRAAGFAGAAGRLPLPAAGAGGAPGAAERAAAATGSRAGAGAGAGPIWKTRLQPGQRTCLPAELSGTCIALVQCGHLMIRGMVVLSAEC